MTFNNYKAEQKVKNIIETDYKKIKVIPGKLRWNYKCHLNSVHEALKKGDKKIAVCVYMLNGEAVVHFINYHKKQFVENTLGQWSHSYDYYFIRWVKQDEFKIVGDILHQYQQKFYDSLGWWLKLTSNVRF